MYKRKSTPRRVKRSELIDQSSQTPLRTLNYNELLFVIGKYIRDSETVSNQVTPLVHIT